MSHAGVSATLTGVLSSLESLWRYGGPMADRDKVVPLRLVDGNRSPEESRCILVYQCGSSNYELAGDGRSNHGVIRCARCRLLKPMTWEWQE